VAYTVLAADDEIELLEVLQLYLEKEGISLLKAADGLEALELFRASEVHLLLLDIMMPKMNGYNVLKEIRKSSSIPAIMLTAKDSDHDKIIGLELGADDYITKPFNPLEVAARIKAQLRRNYEFLSREDAESEAREFQIGSLVLNVMEGTLTKGGAQVPLTSTEFKILSLFMEHPGQVFTKKQIFEHVWNDYYVEDDNSLLVHLSNLRSKIEDDPKHPAFLHTVKGLGYKFSKDGGDVGA